MNWSDTNSLVTSFAIGLVGMGLFLYGKKQARAPQLVVGIAMMIYPYFVPGALWMLLIAAALIGLLVLASKAGW